MVHRCRAGGCSNTKNDGFSLHNWPSNPQFAKLWTRAVQKTRADFSPTPSSKLCSAHFTEDCFEDQTILARAMNLPMKKILKPDAVPSIFWVNHPSTKRPKRKETLELGSTSSSSFASGFVPQAVQARKQPRAAFRKREAARVCIW